jgi:copper(I)-binding protein
VIRSSRRGALPRRILITAAAALVPLVAGCEAGNNAPTLHWHQPTDGTLAYAGTNNSITIANMFVLGAPVGAVLHRGQSAGMFFGLVNTGSPDRLIAIRAPGTAQTVQLPAGGVSLINRARVLLTGPKPAVILRNLVQPLTGGSVVKMYLIFQNAGAITVYVPVMPVTSNYATYLPPVPFSSSPPVPFSPLPAGSGSAHAKATGRPAAPSPSPSASR